MEIGRKQNARNLEMLSWQQARRTLFLALSVWFIHRQASSGVQKRGYFIVESVLIFDVGEVCGVELGITRARNLIREKAPIRRRCSRIVRSGSHQDWYVNPA